MLVIYLPRRRFSFAEFFTVLSDSVFSQKKNGRAILKLLKTLFVDLSSVLEVHIDIYLAVFYLQPETSER